MYLLGLDIGSSSVKAQVLDGVTGKSIASTIYPKQELPMIAHHKGWAEQEPTTWWNCVKMACQELKQEHQVDMTAIEAVGISYQMHGLVLVDKHQEVLRPSIIWCDSRAVAIGEQALNEIGMDTCMRHLLNSPGNFTASKLKWVKENEPEIYEQIDKIMLPGDYIAMKMTGQATITASGLSEGILWDFNQNTTAHLLLSHYGFEASFIPAIVPTFGEQGELTVQAAKELGLKAGTKLAYRAGDQPNNAFSLNVLKAGEIAATAGTSGVVYSVTDQNVNDEEGRVNTFLHVSDSSTSGKKVSSHQNGVQTVKRNGVLLCVNGTGILFSWLRKMMNSGKILLSYPELNQVAAQAPIGSEGLLFYPFGNGAERVLKNQQPNGSLVNINFNTHHKSHLIRAAQEGIAFALNYGFELLNELGAGGKTVKAGRDNMFLSPIFRDAFIHTTQTQLELYNTNGAEGAARGAGVGIGYYKTYDEAFEKLECLETLLPDQNRLDQYQEAYEHWKASLPIQQSELIGL